MAGQVPVVGLEHPARAPKKHAISEQGGAESGALPAPPAEPSSVANRRRVNIVY